MKRTIKEVYDLIKEKRDNAKRDYQNEEFKYLGQKALLQGTIDAYQDTLSLIESSHLLEEDKPVEGSGLEALENIKEQIKIFYAMLDDRASNKNNLEPTLNKLSIIEKKLKALGNIEENLKYGYVFISYDIDNKPLFHFADLKLFKDTQYKVKAQEIIQSKDFIDLQLLRKCKSAYEYNRKVAAKHSDRGMDVCLLSEEEFDLLKETMK